MILLNFYRWNGITHSSFWNPGERRVFWCRIIELYQERLTDIRRACLCRKNY